jgi:hypothetical protein
MRRNRASGRFIIANGYSSVGKRAKVKLRRRSSTWSIFLHLTSSRALRCPPSEIANIVAHPGAILDWAEERRSRKGPSALRQAASDCRARVRKIYGRVRLRPHVGGHCGALTYPALPTAFCARGLRERERGGARSMHCCPRSAAVSLPALPTQSAANAIAPLGLPRTAFGRRDRPIELLLRVGTRRSCLLCERPQLTPEAAPRCGSLRDSRHALALRVADVGAAGGVAMRGHQIAPEVCERPGVPS